MISGVRSDVAVAFKYLLSEPELRSFGLANSGTCVPRTLVCGSVAVDLAQVLPAVLIPLHMTPMPQLLCTVVCLHGERCPCIYYCMAYLSLRAIKPSRAFEMVRTTARCAQFYA
jgi:hypothetical protein